MTMLFISMLYASLLVYLVRVLVRLWVLAPSIKVRSCPCGCHWWIRKWGFWRHLEASRFTDKLQNRWTPWFFEFNNGMLRLSADEVRDMSYPGRGPTWKRSKWLRSIPFASYCQRCASHLS